MRVLAMKILILVSMLGVAYKAEVASQAAEKPVEDKQISKVEQSEKVKLILRTDKKQYRLEEPIQVSIELANFGEEPIYIATVFEINSATSQGPSLEFNIFNSVGKSPGGAIADGAYANYPSDVVEIVKSYYWLLLPKHLYGAMITVDPKLGMKRGEKYRLVATYTNHAPTKWTAEDKGKLRYDVLGGVLRSEVWIEILP